MTQPKIIAVAALLLAAAIQIPKASAQQTDEVLVLNIQLNTVAQGPTTTGHNITRSQVITSEITSRDVIKALGTATGNAFSRRAQLVLLTPTNDLDKWTVQVRDGTSKVDVTAFFGHQAGLQSVASAFVNSRNGNAGDVSYSIDGFSLQSLPQFVPLGLDFNVSGLTVTTQSGIVRQNQVVGQTDRIAAQVSGSGDSQGNLILIQGSISAEGIGTETIAAPPPIDPGGV